jgi:hypothetical protein
MNLNPATVLFGNPFPNQVPIWAEVESAASIPAHT